MQNFQPSGFGQRAIATSQGVVAYYTPVAAPWREMGDREQAFPPLLFLHSLGGGSSAYEWSKVYPAFAADYRVIAPDLIGWGQSSHPMQEYRVENYLTLFAELIEKLAIAPVPVFASSLTAGLVIRLATQRPDLFRMLVVVSPSGYSDFGTSYQQNLSAQIARIPGLDQLIYKLGAANPLAVRSFLQQFLFARAERITDEMVAAYLASAEQMNGEYAALASLRGDICFDLALYMPQLKVPTVMLWGEQAWFSKVRTGKRLASLNPEAVTGFHVIEDAGVLAHLETPERVIGTVWQYLPQFQAH